MKILQLANKIEQINRIAKQCLFCLNHSNEKQKKSGKYHLLEERTTEGLAKLKRNLGLYDLKIPFSAC